MRFYDDEQCSIPRARSSLFAQKNVLRWIMQWFTWGGGGWLGGGLLMTCVVDCQQR